VHVPVFRIVMDDGDELMTCELNGLEQPVRIGLDLFDC
jgi:hypothetical protein